MEVSYEMLMINRGFCVDETVEYDEPFNHGAKRPRGSPPKSKKITIAVSPGSPLMVTFNLTGWSHVVSAQNFQ